MQRDGEVYTPRRLLTFKSVHIAFESSNKHVTCAPHVQSVDCSDVPSMTSVGGASKWLDVVLPRRLMCYEILRLILEAQRRRIR